MARIGARQLSRFTVSFEVSNLRDVYLAEQGQLRRDQVRRVRLRGLVDSGASRLVLPKKGCGRAGDESVRHSERALRGWAPGGATNGTRRSSRVAWPPLRL